MVVNMCLNATELYHAAGSLPGLSQRGGMSSLPAALLEVGTLQLLPSDLGSGCAVFPELFFSILFIGSVEVCKSLCQPTPTDKKNSALKPLYRLDAENRVVLQMTPLTILQKPSSS